MAIAKTPPARRNERTNARCIGRLAGASLLAIGLWLGCARDGIAASAQVPGRASGRIYDPARLRSQPERRSSGRAMKPPSKPDPEVHELTRSRAEVPNPEPQRRGGSGYARRGQYFYASPAPPALRRPGTKPQYANTIPNPEPPRPGARASLRSAATGGLGSGVGAK